MAKSTSKPAAKKPAAKNPFEQSPMTPQQLLAKKDSMKPGEFEAEARRILGENVPRQQDVASFVRALQDRISKQAGPGNALRPMENESP